MLRISALLFAAALLPCSAGAESSRSLKVQLTEYVEAFDLSGLSPAVLNRLRYVVDHPKASHTAKVFEIHDILLAHDALRHEDLHGEPLRLQAELRP
ncbi:hypothetical protein [Antarctobacter jejuensis]|uniref:hypothetical protein n=1 Tax=Antarctobacter jejuensis TaxID=1439938 RepID=UPI003FD5026A